MFQMKQKVTLLYTDVVGWGWGVGGGGLQTRARAAPCFIVDRPNVESFKRSVKYFGAVRWNGLLESTRNEKSLVSFKNKKRTMPKRYYTESA